ncbi:MAG: EpsG family protein [Lachnospiraceae bacterium]|nr:EpsG family protein [Lachnospiraceae bacterium]
MLLYCAVSVITIALAYLVKEIPCTEAGLRDIYSLRVDRQRAINAVATAAIFTILFMLAALRLEVGNDYGTYVVTCHEIFQRGYVVTEPGFNLVVRILYTLSGKEDYLLMFAVFGALIALVFLKVFKDQSDSFFLSFYMFMTMGIYFRTFNTVRYYFALALATYALRYVVNITKTNLIKFFIIIAFAATFHKSVLVVIPLYLIARLPWKRWMYIAVIVFTVTMPMAKNYVMSIALKLYPSYKNTVYESMQHSVSENLYAIAGCITVIVLCLFFYKPAIQHRADNKMYFHMCIMAVALYAGCYYVPLITRFGYYLITSQILLVPGIVSSLKGNEKRRVMILVCMVCALYFLFFLYTADRVGVRVLPYKSFLFHDRYWLNQTDTF